MHCARDWKFHAGFVETAAADFRHERDGRPDAERSASPGFRSISAGNEFDFTGTKLVVDVKAEDCALFAPFCDA